MVARSGLFMRLKFCSIYSVIIEARRQFHLVLKTDVDAIHFYDEPITYSLSSCFNKKEKAAQCLRLYGQACECDLCAVDPLNPEYLSG